MTHVRTTVVTHATTRTVEDAAVAEGATTTTEAAGTMTAVTVADMVAEAVITIVVTVAGMVEVGVITTVEDVIMTGGTKCIYRITSLILFVLRLYLFVCSMSLDIYRPYRICI